MVVRGFAVLVPLAMVVLSACGTAAAPVTTAATTGASTTVTSTIEAGATTAVATTSPAPTTATVPPPALWKAVAPGELDILFVGNSHTSTHDVPTMVESLLESIEGIQVSVGTLKAGFLRMALGQRDVTDAISSGAWDIVILQGQEISMSHSTSYSQDEAVALANSAREAGSRALFFSEWSREGLDETDYIENIYRQMATSAGVELIPIGRSWDRLLADQPAYQLWSDDGNHSSPHGAFLAAATIAYYLVGPDAQLTTSPDLQALLEPARLTIENYIR